MCVPSDVSGVWETDLVSSSPSVVNFASVVSSGPKTMTDTGMSGFRSFRKARAAAIAPANGRALHAVRGVDQQDGACRGASGRHDREAGDGPAVLAHVHARGRERPPLRELQEIRAVREPGARRHHELGRRLLAECQSGKDERGDCRAHCRCANQTSHAVAPRRSSRTVMRSPNMLCGSSMPRFGTCPGTPGEDRVGRRWPVIVRSGATASISNSKMS